MQNETPDSNNNEYHPVGQVITPGDQPQISGAGIDQHPVPPAPKQSKKGLFIVALFLVLLGLGGGAYALFGRQTTIDSTTQTAVKKDVPKLRYAVTSYGWDKFYPDTESSSNFQESNSMLFEGLVRYKNKTNVQPLLAASWTNPDASTWIFKLKQGVKFHTGKEMTAEDVKASFEAAKTSSYGETYGSTIASVSADSTYQVTIKTVSPDPTLLNKLTAYFVYDTTSGKTNDPINGTGPMVITPGTTPSQQSLELTAFDQYHGGHVYVRTMSFTGVEDTESGKAFQDGTYDLVQFSSDQPTAVTSRPYEKIDFASLGNYIMPLNSLRASSPIAKQKVREAIQVALDPTAIAKARGANYVASNQIVPKFIPGYNTDIPAITRDVTKAKQLLAEAGYPNGTSFELTYFAPQQPGVDAITKSLAEAGITVKQNPQTDTSKLGDLAFGGKTDAYLTTDASDILDASDVVSRYADSPNYKNETALNYLTEAQSTLDSSKHINALQKAVASISANNGVAFIYTPVNTDSVIYASNLYVPRENENNALGVYIQDVYAK